MKQTILTILLALCVFAGTSTTAHAGTVIKSIPLTLEAIADGTITVSNPKSGMQYSVNGGAKTAVTTDPISVSAKDVVAFYGDGTNIKTYFGTNGTQIQCSADCYIYGNIMSLVDEDGFATNTTQMGPNTFTNLFKNNIHIKNHNDKELVLPATTLTYNCYRWMFYGCTGLTKAPELPAKTLTYCCYYGMFYGCTNLNYVKCLATDISADGCTDSWLKGVATTGTFAMISNTAWTTGVSGIPSGWTVKGLDYLLPLTLEAIADGEITVSNPKSGMQYSVNGGAKTAVTTDPISVSANDVVAFYGNGKEITMYDDTQIQCSADCYIYGNIMSLVDEDGFATNKTLTGEYAFFKLFNMNTHLKSHSDKELVLPATTLTKGCYYNMFCGCTSLKKVPALPATTLADECYACMFYNCTGLKKAPALPATTLTKGCYKSMFFGCTGLTTAPALPATTLVDGCYSTMFSCCTNLNYVLCLATDISAKYCNLWLSDVAQTGTFVKIANTAWTTGVSGIPSGWTVIDIVNYNLLPLTLEAIADGEITVSNPKSGMQYSVNGGAKTAVTTDPISVSANDVVAFYGNGKEITMYDDTQIQCSADCYIYGNIMSLVDEDGFATNKTLTGEYAFFKLFNMNTHLKSHSDKELVLPATTLTKGCYYEMFNGCTSLTTAPALPASTLAKGCYASMFAGCTGLTTAPELPAIVLKDGCYDHMFSGCTNLNYVLCLATDISAIYYTTQWLNDVAQTGTFVKAANSTWTTGPDGIPNGWTVIDSDNNLILPLTLEAIADGTITISHPQTGMKYSLNRGPKRTASDSDVTIDVSKGDVVEFYGNGTSITSYSGTQIQCSADCYIYGNIMSLVDETGFVTNKTLTGERTFSGLFENNTHLKNHSDKELVMPATTLTYGCYSNMFWGCTSLTTAPELPATTLSYYCYGCMFTGCTGLTKAPELPATTLQPDCYIQMFADCTGLTKAPALPATTLQPSCYYYMFYGCTNLNNVKCLATDISAQDCTYGWIYNTAKTGTFVKAANSTWTTGPDGIPSGWTVVEALSDNANNADGITALADNQSHNIMLYGRTIYRDGDWNTLCLPFDVDNLKGTPLDEATVMELDVETSNLKDGTLTLYFKDTESIKAGKPYIVKWDTPATDISNPLFEKVTVDASASTSVAFDGGSFIGSYSPVALPVNDTSNLFLGSNNTLYWPNGANNEDGNYYLNACRAYFHVNDVAAVREFVLNFDEAETTGISNTNLTNRTNNSSDSYNSWSENNAWFSLDGRKLESKPSAKGLYIYKGNKVAIK